MGMKFKGRIPIFILVIAVFFCFMNREGTNASAANVKLNKSKLSMVVGESMTLKLKNTKRKTTWKSTNVKIVVVNKNGKITALKNGRVKVIAKNAGKKYVCEISVKRQHRPNPTNKPKTDNTVENVTVVLSQTSAIIEQGGQIALSVNVLPASYQKDVLWKSDNEEIATVNEGIITGVGVGSCNITATVGNVSATCFVQVKMAYGILSGTVTYHYNQYRGYVADVGAGVYVLDIINKKVVGQAQVDGNRNYLISNIPIGEYKVVFSSKNSLTSAYNDKNSVHTADVNYYRSTYKIYVSSTGRLGSDYFVNILANQTTNSSYQFGYTEF